MATRFSFSRLRATDANNRVMPGAKLAFYQSGTSTPKAIYSDAALTVPHLNPVEADAAGRFPDIYLDTGLYKATLLDAADAPQWTSDPVGKEVLDETQITIASQGQAETGTDNTVLMTPLRTDQHFDARLSDLEWIGNRGRIQGLALANNGTDANNDIDIAAGYAACDTSPFLLMSLNAGLTKRLDAAWAVGSGSGGLDTGSKANSTWYYVWLIRRPDTGVVDALFSISATAPTMPADYTQKRRIGAIRTDGSGNILGFTQRVDTFWWNLPALDFNGTATSANRSAHPLRVPPSAIAIFTLLYDAGAGASGRLFRPEEADAAVTATAAPLGHINGQGTLGPAAIYEWPTNSNGEILFRASSGTPALRLSALGWIDVRGRHD